MSGKPCLEKNCGTPRYNSNARCRDHAITRNQAKACVDCGKSRHLLAPRCELCNRDHRRKAHQFKWANDAAHRERVTTTSRAWIKAHPDRYRTLKQRHRKKEADKRAADPEYAQLVRDTKTAKRYKMTVEQYREMLANGCTVCGVKINLHVDHDHTCCPGQETCGKCTRGILCRECNQLLGMIEKDLGRVRSLLAYSDLEMVI